MTDPNQVFTDPGAVARYAEGPPRLVPGFEALQRMTSILIAERAPPNARVLVVGAGGGLELKVFAEDHPGWTFDGVDPSAPMLKLAAEALGLLSGRAALHEGYVDAAPDGPFDAATCLLTLHFVAREERLRTLKEIRRRLRQGAPFVAAHFSLPPPGKARDLWLSRYVAFAIYSGVERERIAAAEEAIGGLPILTPQQDEADLIEAGFSDVSLFYCGFTFRGWIAYA